MKIGVGKFYRTRNGDVVGPIRDNTSHDEDYPFIDQNWVSYTADGHFHTGHAEHYQDLIAEAEAPAPSPARDQDDAKQVDCEGAGTTRSGQARYAGQQTRSAILREAEQIVNSDRNSTYGEPEDNFDRIAKVWNVLFSHKLNGDVFTAKDVALALSGMKTVRLSQAPSDWDSVVDMIGYGACYASCLESEKAKA